MNSLVTVAGVAALLLSPLAAQANSDAITFPRAGEVCDQVGQVCYDSYGPSIGITKIYFGQFAADRLSQNLSRSSSRDFRLSRSLLHTSRWPSRTGSAASARPANPCSMDPAISSRW